MKTARAAKKPTTQACCAAEDSPPRLSVINLLIANKNKAAVNARNACNVVQSGSCNQSCGNYKKKDTSMIGHKSMQE